MNNPPWISNRNSASGWQEANIGMMATQPSFHLPTVNQSNQMGGMQQGRTGGGDSGQQKQRVFTGAITKVSDTFGFVDEDVFFQIAVCKGGNPKVGDKVLVEATFNANMPFKWNATRIQIIPNMPGITPNTMTQQTKPAYQQYGSMHQSSAAPKYGQSNQGAAQQRSSMSSSQVKPSYQTSSYSYKPSAQSNSSSSSSRTSRFDQRSGGSSSTSQPARSSQTSRRSPHRDNRSRRYSPTPASGSTGSRKRSRSPRRSRSPVGRRRSKSPRRSRSPRARSPRFRSRSRSRSPKYRRRSSPARPAPKYSVHAAPHSLNVCDCSVMELKSRYSSLYVPSDFSTITYNWVESFPLINPFEMKPVDYHVLSKDVLPDTLMAEGETRAELEPADFNYGYSAKVMLLATPAMEQLYKMCCNLAEPGTRGSDIREHPAKVIQFLVGYKQGKQNEPIAIGGPWSPSLDGSDPATNPQTLINTAIRTTKSLTGIDLSKCTRWYRFLELDYLRTDVKKTGYTKEKVVVFLPDVWTCVPTILEYKSIQEKLNSKLEERFKPAPREPTPEPEKPADVEKDTTDKAAEEKTDASLIQEEEMETTTQETGESQAADPLSSGSQMDTSVAEDSAMDDSTAGADIDKDGLPTHWSKLEVKSMKVADLKAELEARDESTKGLKKPQLVTKLMKILKQEQTNDEKKQTDSVESKENEKSSADDKESSASEKKEESAEGKKDAKMETEEKKEEVKSSPEKQEKPDVIEIKDDESEVAEPKTGETTASDKPAKKKEPTLTAEQEAEKKRVEKYYKLPSDPCLVILPDREARGGKFDCTLMSLNVLLDYRHDDNKEHMFEVSLFAEAFNEMLMRDFGFQIYHKLAETYETRIRDEKRKKEREERERKEKEERERKEKEEREKREKEERERKEREEKERKEREEKERKEREEERIEREEREKKEKEEQEKLEKEKKEQEEKERLEKEEADKKAAEEKEKGDAEMGEESEAKTDADDKTDEKMDTDADTKEDEKTAEQKEEELKQKKAEEEQLKKKKEEELKKKKEEELKKKKEEELKKKKEEELKKKKEAEAAELKRKHEAEEAELKRKYEAEVAELKRKKEAEEEELKKKKAAEEAELKKKEEEGKKALESSSKTSAKGDDKKRPREKSEEKVDSKKIKTEIKRPQPMTVDKKSLLAFTYYDSNRCGYILDKDLEEILYTLGLKLSRSQVTRIIKKCVTGDAVHYKRLTDINDDKLEEYAADKITINPSTLVQGLEETEEASSAEVSTGSSLVKYKGSYIDLESVLSRLEAADKIKSDLEAEMKNITSDRDTLRNTVSSLEDGTNRLQQKLKTTRDELDYTIKNRNAFQTEAEDYKRVLTSSSQDLTKVLRRVNSLILPEDKSEKKE